MRAQHSLCIVRASTFVRMLSARQRWATRVKLDRELPMHACTLQLQDEKSNVKQMSGQQVTRPGAERSEGHFSVIPFASIAWPSGPLLPPPCTQRCNHIFRLLSIFSHASPAPSSFNLFPMPSDLPHPSPPPDPTPHPHRPPTLKLDPSSGPQAQA